MKLSKFHYNLIIIKYLLWSNFSTFKPYKIKNSTRTHRTTLKTMLSILADQKYHIEPIGRGKIIKLYKNHKITMRIIISFFTKIDFRYRTKEVRRYLNCQKLGIFVPHILLNLSNNLLHRMMLHKTFMESISLDLNL